MKFLAILSTIAICLSTAGCGTMAHLMHSSNYTAPSDDYWIDAAGKNSRSGSFQFYNSNPYALHLEIEETDSQGELEPLNGDGGASLNAYAACLTLKVIF